MAQKGILVFINKHVLREYLKMKSSSWYSKWKEASYKSYDPDFALKSMSVCTYALQKDWKTMH